MRFLVLFLVTLASCELFGPLNNPVDRPGSGTAPVVAVASVSVNKASTSLLVKGTEQLTATVLPANATDPRVVWTSEKPTVVSVTEAGVLEGLAVGTSKVTVTTRTGGKSSWCDVTVSQISVPVTGVTLNRSSVTLSLVPGQDTFQLVPNVSPSDATNQNLAWKSSDPGKVSVSSTGLVTALVSTGATPTTITAEAADKQGAAATCLVTVDTDAPAAVTGLTAAEGNGQVALQWTNPTDSDFTGVEITWLPAEGPGQPLVQTAPGSSTVVSGLTNGTSYTFTVKATDAVGNHSLGTMVGKAPSSSVTYNWRTLSVPTTVGGAASWNQMVTSMDGQKLLTFVWSGFSYASLDGGDTWLENTSAGTGLSRVEGTSDLGVLYGLKNNSGASSNSIFKSTDLGATWNALPNSPKLPWQSLSCSADGLYVAANSGTSSPLYHSEDGGATWTASQNLTNPVYSPDGTTLYATSAGLWVSRDHGINWTSCPEVGATTATPVVAKNGIGFVWGSDKFLYRTLDNGVTWEKNTAGGTLNNLNKLAVSADGTGLAYTQNVSGSYLWTSPDSGNTWTPAAALGKRAYWYSPVFGPESSTLTIIADLSETTQTSHVIYRTRDTGATWSTLPTISTRKSWAPVSIASDNRTLVGGFSGGYLYRSNDVGLNWTELRNSGLHAWTALAQTEGPDLWASSGDAPLMASADGGSLWATQSASTASASSVATNLSGTVLMVAQSLGSLRRSGDGGKTFTFPSIVNPVSTTSYWRTVALSSDGKYGIATRSQSLATVYVSSDFGQTWTGIDMGQGSTRDWRVSSISSDGRSMAVAQNLGVLMTSSDYGATWTVSTSAGSKTWVSLSYSGDGQMLAAVGDTFLFVSNDGGVSWVKDQLAGSRSWTSVRVAPDRSFLIATVASSSELWIGTKP